jgi:aryl-alcohol dehydrogenase-like predicted oxidoreductase
MSLYRDEGALWGAVHESSRILRHHVDLLQIHEADRSYWWAEDAGSQKTVARSEDLDGCSEAPVVRVMERAKREGVCRFVGATGNSAGPLRTVCENLAIDSVMCAYNLDPIYRGAAEKIAPLAEERGLLFMAAGIFHAGSFMRPQNLPDRLASDPSVKKRFERFAHICEESGLPPAELLLRWTTAFPRVNRWVVSASSPQQIENTVEMMRRGPLPDDLHRVLEDLALPGFEYDPAAR